MPAQMILVAGPHRSGTNDDPVKIAANVAAMTGASLALFRAGHLPVMANRLRAVDRTRWRQADPGCHVQ